MKRLLPLLLSAVLLVLNACHPEPFLSVSPDSLSFSESGGSQTVQISANYAWTASVSGPGFSVSPNSGEGNATVTVTASASSSPDESSGTLSVRSEGLSASVALSQSAKPTIILGDGAKVPASGGSVEIQVQYNTDYTVEVEASAQSWIKFIKTKSLSSGKLEFEISANEGDERSGRVTVKDNSGKASPVSVTITQEGEAKVLVVGNAATVPAEGATVEVEVQYNVDYAVEVEESAKSWIHYVETKAVQSGKLVFKVDANDGDERTGTVTVRDISGKAGSRTITFVQESGIIPLTAIRLDPDKVEAEIGDEVQLTVIFEPENATDKFVSWDTDNPDVAYFTSLGTVVCVTVGNATVTATVGGLTATCEITVVEPASLIPERAALEAFYRANNGYNWPDQGNWCTDAPLCEWTGVTMTPDGKHVQALELWYNEVEGFIPEEIADLTELESLSINNQYYSSNAWPLPEAIGSLKKLKFLQFQCYTLGGTLPESLFRLKNLEVLRINNAEGMTPGPIPPEIGNLTGLKELCLSMAKLTGEVPPEIGNLTNLVKLQLFGNELTGSIPESFGNLVNLEKLDMSGNQLSGDIPAAFYRVRNYWMLWPELVEDNNFTQENIRNAKIPAPKSPTIKMLSGKTLDLEEEFDRNQYTVIIKTGPEFDSWDIFPSLISLYEANKDKGFNVITYYDNNWDEEEDIREHDKAFKEKLQSYNVPWDSFIRHMGDPDPSAASGETSPFYAKGGSGMYPFGSVDEIVVIGPDRTVHYTTLIDHTEDKAQLQHFMEYIHDILGSPLVRYESKDFSADGKVTALQRASVGQGVDIVITGDGYSDRLIADGTFHRAALQAAEDFFSIEPFKSLRDRFNVYQVDAVSRNEEIFNGCSTVFSTRFAGATALTGDNETALEYAAKAVSDSRMDDVVVLVLVNSGLSGGTAYMMQAETDHYAAGSSVTWVPYKNVPVNDGISGKAMVLIHEAGGHGFGKLDDEYSINYYGKPDKETIDYLKECHKKGMFVNVDVTDDPNEVIWSRYIGDERFASENIGVYKGGAGFFDGVWRPTENSVMRTNSLNKNNFFNAPSRAQIYTRIMKLSEGQSWEFDYEGFVNWDQLHPTTVPAKSSMAETDGDETFDHRAPVMVRQTWRQVMKRRAQSHAF